ARLLRQTSRMSRDARPATRRPPPRGRGSRRDLLGLSNRVEALGQGLRDFHRPGDGHDPRKDLDLGVDRMRGADFRHLSLSLYLSDRSYRKDTPRTPPPEGPGP